MGLRTFEKRRTVLLWDDTVNVAFGPVFHNTTEREVIEFVKDMYNNRLGELRSDKEQVRENWLEWKYKKEQEETQ